MGEVNLNRHPPKPMTELIMLISSGLASINTLTVAVIGWAAAFVVGVILQTQENPWYQVVIPAIVSAVIPSTIILVSEILKIRRERQKSKDERAEREDDKHLSYSERLAELNVAERAKLLEERDRTHRGAIETVKREAEFYKFQAEFRKLETFEARMRAHALNDELNRILLCMNVNGITLPDFKLKSEDEMSLEIELKVAAYKQKLEKEKDALIHFAD